MTNHQDNAEGRRHSLRILSLLDELMRHVWRDIDKGSEPQAQALFQKTIEVLNDLKTAYEHYEVGIQNMCRH